MASKNVLSFKSCLSATVLSVMYVIGIGRRIPYSPLPGPIAWLVFKLVWMQQLSQQVLGIFSITLDDP
jgi:hypothetical protein